MAQEHEIVAELRHSGSRLWSSVDCDVRPNCIVVYARLSTHPRLDVAGALAESEELLKAVLERRLEGRRSWVAAVQWSERLCRTIRPAADVAPSAAPSHR
jgi:hypothetical protein